MSHGRLSLCLALKMRRFEIEMIEEGTYTLQPYLSFLESMSPFLVRMIEDVLDFVSTKVSFLVVSCGHIID